jgi:hypothetical protein
MDERILKSILIYTAHQVECLHFTDVDLQGMDSSTGLDSDCKSHRGQSMDINEYGLTLQTV